MHSNRVLRFNPFWNVRLFSTNLLFFGSFSKGITAGSSWSKDAKARLNSISVHEEAFSELNDLFKAVRKVGGSSGWSIMIAINFWKFFFHSVPCGATRKPTCWKVCRCANSCKVVIRKAYGFKSPLTVIWGFPFKFLGRKSPHFVFLPFTILKCTPDSTSNSARRKEKHSGTNFENVYWYFVNFSTDSKINRNTFHQTAQNKYYLYRREVYTKHRYLFFNDGLGIKETSQNFHLLENVYGRGAIHWN